MRGGEGQPQWSAQCSKHTVNSTSESERGMHWELVGARVQSSGLRGEIGRGCARGGWGGSTLKPFEKEATWLPTPSDPVNDDVGWGSQYWKNG